MKGLIVVIALFIPALAADTIVSPREVVRNPYQFAGKSITIKGTFNTSGNEKCTTLVNTGEVRCVPQNFYIEDSIYKVEVIASSEEAKRFFGLATHRKDETISKSLCGSEFLFKGTGMVVWGGNNISTESYSFSVTSIEPVKNVLAFSNDTISSNKNSVNKFTVMNIGTDTARIDSLFMDKLPFVSDIHPGFFIAYSDSVPNFGGYVEYGCYNTTNATSYIFNPVSGNSIKIPPKVVVSINIIHYLHDIESSSYFAYAYPAFSANIYFAYKEEIHLLNVKFPDSYPDNVIRAKNYGLLSINKMNASNNCFSINGRKIMTEKYTSVSNLQVSKTSNGNRANLVVNKK